MTCPYYHDMCMCSAGKVEISVPFKEVEYNFCRTDDHTRCEAYRKAARRSRRKLPERARGDSAALAG